jgi:hypothetical protein
MAELRDELMAAITADVRAAGRVCPAAGKRVGSVAALMVGLMAFTSCVF